MQTAEHHREQFELAYATVWAKDRNGDETPEQLATEIKSWRIGDTYGEDLPRLRFGWEGYQWARASQCLAQIEEPAGAAPADGAPRARDLLGIVRTAQAEARRLINGEDSGSDLAQTKHDLPETLRVLEHALSQPAAVAGPADEDLRKALQFYANGEHFILSERDTSWDTVSGEPQNYWCDEAGTATVEDGTIAKMALAGQPIDFEEDDAAPALEAPAAPMGQTLARDEISLWAVKTLGKGGYPVISNTAPFAAEVVTLLEAFARDHGIEAAPSAAPAAPGMAVTALAGEIIAALEADEKDGGYDLTSGLFGPKFSALVRRWAASEWAHITAPQAPAAPSADERAAYVEFLTGKFPRSYGKEEAGRWWDQGHVSALTWQAARAALDAARYRWLRDKSVPPHNFYLSVPDEFKDERYSPREVDAAIDAALAAQAQQKGPQQ